jgi:Flp pilus assembly protein TadD
MDEAVGARPDVVRVAELTAGAEQRLQEKGWDPETVLEPFEIDPEMIEWARDLLPNAGPANVKLSILLTALRDSKEPRFEYAAGFTGTVKETYRTGRYNCLSFSMMFVTLARAAGLPASFLGIRRDLEYRRIGDLVVLTRHITAGYGPFTDRVVLEFDIGPELDYTSAEPLSDTEALALWYSNRGTEEMRAEKLDEAIEMFEIAITLAPHVAQPWLNLGVAYRRADRLDDAREASLKASELEPDSLSSYQNLAVIYRHAGDEDAASRLIGLLSERRNLNPFMLLALGDDSLRERRLEDARRFYQRALKMARSEAETHAAMGLWALYAGKRDRALDWLESATQIDPENDRVRRLRLRIEHGPRNPV